MAVRAGELSLDQFVRMTRPDFTRLAAKLVVRAPSWIDVDDVVQEMLLSVPIALKQWRSGDYPLKRFIVFRACSAGRRVIKRAVEYRKFESRQHPKTIEVSRAIQHEHVEVCEHVSALIRELPQTDAQQAVIESLARTQSVERSMQELLRDPRTRFMFSADDDLVRSKMRRMMSILADRAAIRQAK
jgi:DNA-directed RNA polymerase specialized sigma24 family protein